MNCKFSFIMPAYKAHYLQEAIDSILSQTFADFELVIVDDASPENIERIVLSYNDARLHYYRNEQNIGGSNLVAQWNKCLAFASGNYVILATDDDVYHPDFLVEMNRLVDKYPDCNAFRPRVVTTNSDLIPTEVDGYMPEFADINTFLYFFLRRIIWTGIGFWVFNRNALIASGGYSEMPMAWWSDDLTAIKMASNGVAFSPNPLYYFRFSSESISTKRNNGVAFRMKLKATEKFYSQMQCELNSLTSENDKI